MDARERIEQCIRHSGLLVLDGGLATQLEHAGCDLDDPLWSARMLLGEDGHLAAVHRAYAEAGADVITSATYQASIPGLERRGLSWAQVEAVLESAVRLARAATCGPDGTGRPLIAASVGSYGAFLANGAEYHGDYGVDAGALHRFHAPRLRILEREADLLAIETIPSALEARVLADLLADDGPPAWMSFSCRDARTLADGTPLAEVAEELAPARAIVAVGVNCVPPSMVADAIIALRGHTDAAIVVYPNSGERFVSRGDGWDGPGLDPAQFAESARHWHTLGATWIGGCCRTTPAHIRALRDLDLRA